MSLKVKTKGSVHSLAFDYGRILAPTDDLNDYVSHPGVYKVDPNTINAPTGMSWSLMLVMSVNNDWVQLVLPVTAGKNVYLRHGNTSTERFDDWEIFGGGS